MAAVPDDALVVRGGLCEDHTLRRSAERCFDRHGYYGLSVWADSEMSIVALILVADIKHRNVWRGRARGFKANGFEIAYTGDPLHATVYLGDSIADDEIWVRFRESFEELIANPVDL